MDDNEAVLLVLLDMSAAFDTVDAKLLMDTMEHRFSVIGTARDWFSTYMTGRHYSVKVGNEVSMQRELKYGVPQGSVLRPFLFTIYTAEIEDIIKKHGLLYHKFADDIQIYIIYNPEVPMDLECALFRIRACVAEVRCSLTRKKLKLNEDKTEFIALMSAHQLSKFGAPLLQLSNVLIKSAKSVRNLGPVFDQLLSMHDYVNQICSKAAYHIRRIGSIRQYITTNMCCSLVMSLVVSNLDYCNCLLAGLHSNQIARLQRLQHRAARLITRSHLY